MYPNSYYAATANALPEQSALGAQSLRADVCIIGAGFTGLSTALHLAKRGANVVVLESQRIGWGASGRNGGQLYGGQRKDVDWLEARLGKAEARRLWDLGEAAKNLVKQLIAELAIECDLTPGIAQVAHKPRYVAEYHALADKLATQYGRQGLEKIDAKRTRELLGTDAYFGGYVDWDAAHLHPLNLALGVARNCIDLGVRIYENTRATAFVDGTSVSVRTSTGDVTADHLVLAANGHLGNLAPKLAGRMMPINNFIIATEPLDEGLANEINPRRVAVGDSRFVINYFRMTPDRRLLFGGGENYRAGFPRDIAAFVRPLHVEDLPATRGREDRLRMGRHAGDHAEPDAALRALEQARTFRTRLLGARRGARAPRGAIDRRNAARRVDALRCVCRNTDAALSGRSLVALARHGRRHAVFLAPRSNLIPRLSASAV